MPVIAPYTPALPTSGGEVLPPPMEIPEAGYASVTYYDPTGTAWPMTNQEMGWFALAEGISGLGAAPRALTSDPLPRGGARLRHSQPLPRTIVWPIMVQGSDHTEFIARWRSLATAFTRTLREGPGILEFARPDGTRRQIQVHYQEGFEGRGVRASGITWDSAVLTLFCEDPFWYDPVPQTIHREQDGSEGEDYFQPYPSITSGQVLGSTTVENAGDVVVWPTWVITGPASSVTFTNDDTGEQFILDPSEIGASLDAGETVTVTTDPPRVRFQNGDNWIGTLNWPGATLWGLPPGTTNVTFALAGSDVGSAVDLTYHPRYETA